MRRLLAVALLAVAAAGTAEAAPPAEGVVVPGRSFAGVRLGMTGQEVLSMWGTRHGVCRACRRTTWYFNLERFAPEGAGVELRKGRVVAAFTLWKPSGWRTREGLVLGETTPRITEVYGPLTKVECGRYYALTIPHGRTVTALYVADDRLWGFGLMRQDVPVCR